MPIELFCNGNDYKNTTKNAQSGIFKISKYLIFLYKCDMSSLLLVCSIIGLIFKYLSYIVDRKSKVWRLLFVEFLCASRLIACVCRDDGFGWLFAFCFAQSEKATSKKEFKIYISQQSSSRNENQ